jgi:transcriptional regulator with XRE-family HTH domain
MYNKLAIADMLRRQRAAVDPLQAGIVDIGARRTPGLRREEVAILANVSASWYQRLEQGRDVRPSREVLDSLADALHMDDQQRRHLLLLGGFTSDAARPLPERVTRSITDLVESISQPAHVINSRFDVLAWNEHSAHLLTDFGAFSGADRNVLRLVFQDDALRRRYVDWETRAREFVSAFRATCDMRAADESLTKLAEELDHDNPDFRRLWEDHEVQEHVALRKTLVLPGSGEVNVVVTNSAVDDDPDLRLLVFTPADQASAIRLASTTPTPGRRSTPRRRHQAVARQR